MGSVAGFGVTVMLANEPALTTTVAVPDTAPLVARTVLVNMPAATPAVNRPVPLMEPPPATTDQLGARATVLPLMSRPTAANCCVAPMPSVAGFGVTTMVASRRHPPRRWQRPTPRRSWPSRYS